MKIYGSKLLQPILDLDGAPIELILKPGEQPEPITVLKAMRSALLTAAEGDREDGETKFKHYQLATRLTGTSADGELELSAEEITLIKRKVGQAWGAVIVGFVFLVLEG